jgi:hypothetical protein
VAAAIMPEKCWWILNQYLKYWWSWSCSGRHLKPGLEDDENKWWLKFGIPQVSVNPLHWSPSWDTSSPMFSFIHCLHI